MPTLNLRKPTREDLLQGDVNDLVAKPSLEELLRDDIDELVPVNPAMLEDKAIKQTLDMADANEMSLGVAERGLDSFVEIKKKKDAIGIGLGPLWDESNAFDTRTMRERLGLEPKKTYTINFGALLAEIPKGLARFLERDIGGTFGGTTYDWLGQFIERGGLAVKEISYLGQKDKERIYNPIAESIIATGQNISQYGKEARQWYSYHAATGWEAMDEHLRETDPVSYGAGRLTEGVASSALSVLAVYLSGGVTAAPELLNTGLQINRGLVALSTISAAGGFEHAQNQKENFYWATLHGLADGMTEYVMETSFLADVGKGTGKLVAGAKEGAEEFFTGMLQNTRAGILENEAKGMSAYDASKKAVKAALVQSPWEVAAGFIGGFGVAGGSNLVQLMDKSKQLGPLAKGIQKEVGVSAKAAKKAVDIAAKEGVTKADQYLSAVKTVGEAAAEKVIAEEQPPEIAEKLPSKPIEPRKPAEAVKAPTEAKVSLETTEHKDFIELESIEAIPTGTGAGTKALQELIDKAEKPIRLTVAKSNTKAQALYEKLGFKEITPEDDRITGKRYEYKPKAKVEVAKVPVPEGYGAKNTLVTTEAYEAAKAKLAEAEPLKGEQKKGFRKGAARIFTPEDLIDVGKIGLYHFEAGTREFAVWSKRMISEFGNSIKPHLKKIWEEVESQRVPGKERGFITSVKNALPQLKVEGQYVPRSIDKLSIKARNLINDDIKQAEKIALKGNDDNSVAVASELIKYYGEQAAIASDDTVKDALYEKAAVIANDAAAKLTELGRAVQAASILSRLTPEGQVRFAAREIQKYNERIEKSKGGLFGLKKKAPELTPQEAEEILNEMKAIDAMPPGTDKAKRFQKLQNKIADMVPTSLFQKAIQIWKAGLLTGIKTSGLNIFANVSHVATETAASIPATMVDKIVSIGTGKRAVTVTIKGLGRGTVKGVKKGADYLITGYDERNIGVKLDYKKKSLGKGKTARALQAYTDTVFRVLGAEDQPFYYAAKIRSLHEQAKVSAINKGFRGKKAAEHINNLMDNPTEQMVKNASKDAEATVFQNKTALGDLAKGIQGLGKGAGEIIVPFGRTPSAVAMQIVNYSPVGTVKMIIENIGKGKFNQRAFSQGIGRSIVGAIPLVIGAALLDNDMLTLDYPKTEKERKQWELEGRKANSVKVAGKWRTVQTLGPAGNLLIVGGHFRRAFKESGSPSEAMATALAGSGKSFTEQTFLQGINQFSAALNDPERSGPRLARGLVSSVIPTIVGDVARATDPLERRTESVGERVIAKIPGARKKLEPRVTVLGEEVKATANPLEIMIDPTRPSKEINDPVVKELRRLFDAGHEVTPSLLGDKEGYDLLTQRENTNLWKRAGQLINESLNEMITNPESKYKSWSDEAKASAIDIAVDTNKAVAKAEVVAKKIKGLKGADLLNKLAELRESGLLTSDLLPIDAEMIREKAKRIRR